MKQMISRWMGWGCVLALSLAATTLQAAPKQVELVYEATRNGQPFATITESYKQENGRYRIESVTKGVGVYALFGERRLISEGEVTAEGLKPSHFELHQGDNARKSLFADFDWAGNKLTMKVKGNPTTVPLETGAQDISSLLYQFMFKQPSGEQFNLPVTTGKKFRNYQYKVTARDTPLAVPAGNYKTIHLVEAAASSDEKELWLGAEGHYLPVKLVMRDDNGAKIEQILTSLHAE